MIAVTGTTLATTAVTLASAGATAPGTAWTAGPRHASLVIARPGQVAAAAAAVTAAGGKVGKPMPIINGFAAQVSDGAAKRLTGSASIVGVSADSAMTSASSSYDPSTPGASYAATSRATGAWNSGSTGAGVTVAVLDTGVAKNPDLGSRLSAGPDLSGEGNSLVDSFGHGTVMAGLIAGNGQASGGAYPGIAPGAKVISVKVAGRSGATDVSQVLLGLQWIGSFADRYNIRVVSLAWGTPSHQSTLVDPLNFAVERLWGMGITVVVAAGNSGPGPMTITKPGDDPVVITAGAFNDLGTVSAGDDAGLDFSAHGPTVEGVSKPDVVAPGRTLIATRAPGSTIERKNPQALVGDNYIRGSGTSQATAVTAGGVALLLSSRPHLSPDQVKYALKATAQQISGVPSAAQGSGELRLSRAVSTNVSAAPQQQLAATGLGSLEASRGGVHVMVMCPGESTWTELQGETDARCADFSSDQFASDQWLSDQWLSDQWLSDQWLSDQWLSDQWLSDQWLSDQWLSDQWLSDQWLSAGWDAAPAPPSGGQACVC